MKTKKSKDWFGRTKNRNELHSDSRNWLSEIKFINYEMKFLNNLLSSNYIELIESGYNDIIRDLVKKIAVEKKSSKDLQKLLLKHESILADLIRTNSVTSNTNFLETHKKFEIEFNIYSNRYKELKKEIFKIVERIMKKKSQKTFPRSKNILKIEKT